MAANFSFTLPPELCELENLSGVTFKSPDGEEYTVKPVLVRQHYGYYREIRDSIKLDIGWKTISSKLIKVQRYRNPELLDIQSVLVKDAISTSIDFNESARDFRSAVLKIIITPHILPNASVKKPLVSTLNPKQEPVIGKKLDRLSKDMKSILQTGFLSDIVLTDGKNEIKAHKVVLSMRSTVFAKMLQSPMKEQLENRITIEDISIPVLMELLNFMYSGVIVIKDAEMARNLYIAADKYDVKELKNICSGILQTINLETVLDTLLLADLHNDKALKNAALNFVSQNYSEVKALQIWNSFIKDNQLLTIEILSFVIDKKA